jgi:hypothetical protein
MGAAIQEVLGIGRERFAGCISFMVGDGRKVRFWHEIWFKDYALRKSFPDFY